MAQSRKNIITHGMSGKVGDIIVFSQRWECQGYVEPCEFGSGKSFYDDDGLFVFGLMFRGFDYPLEVDTDVLSARFWQAKMDKGIIEFPRPEMCTVRREIRNYSVKNPKIKAEEDA